MEGRKWQKGRILTRFLYLCIAFAQIPPFPPPRFRFFCKKQPSILPKRRTEGLRSVFFEKRHGDHAGTGVRADHTANERGIKRLHPVLPDVAAILHILVKIDIA